MNRLLAGFFEYMPQGEFKMLNLAHILIIVFGILAILVACFFLRKLESKKVKIILLVCAIIGLVIDPIYWIWELCATGTLHWEQSLPLYFCSLFYMTLAVGVFCKRERVKQVCFGYLASFNVFAGLMGLILNNNLNNYPVFSFVGIRTLVFHLLMLFVSALIWFTRYYKPKFSDIFTFMIPLGIMFIPALIVDKIWGFDYCYLNGGKGIAIIENVSGAMPNVVYIILLYLLIFVATNVVFYIPTIVKYIKEKKGEKKIGKD